MDLFILIIGQHTDVFLTRSEDDVPGPLSYFNVETHIIKKRTSLTHVMYLRNTFNKISVLRSKWNITGLEIRGSKCYNVFTFATDERLFFVMFVMRSAQYDGGNTIDAQFCYHKFSFATWS